MLLKLWLALCFTLNVAAQHVPYVSPQRGQHVPQLGLQLDYRHQNDWPGKCRTGKRQSPIAIPPESKQVRVPLIGLTFYNFDVPVTASTMKNDRGIRAMIKPKDKVPRFIILNDYFKTTDIKPVPYVVDNFNFHWGSKAYEGTNHAVHGRKLAFETNVVTFKQEYGSYDNAENYKDGIIIFAILNEEVPGDNPCFGVIAELGSKIMYQNETASTPSEDQIRLDQLFPKSLDFYWYKGSLDHHPCHESVTWLVLKNHGAVGTNQIPFRNWSFSSDGRQYKLRNSNRVLQPLNGRKVFRSDFYGVQKTTTSWKQKMCLNLKVAMPVKQD